MGDSPIIKSQLGIYGPAVERHGDAPQATFATGPEVQALRFERLMAPLLALDVEAFSIHDVGAGLCDLHGWLVQRGIEHRYSATEIVPEMIEIAHAKYPGVSVERRDLLAAEPGDRHDFVVQSGMFNIPGAIERAEWSRFVWQMIERMYAMAEVAIAFNFLTAYRTRTDPALFYVDPREVVDRCITRLSRFVRVDQSYPLFEATVCVLRPEWVARVHDPAVFGRYFGHGTPRPDGA